MSTPSRTVIGTAMRAPMPAPTVAPTFEQTYPQAPFAELIRLGIALATRAARWRDRARHAVIPPHVAISH